ncbi:uncharacterized protein Meltrin [Chelonus insularis]|uniref:uncharacterized protein Meltrin n=1 Tax=Chelonus insularis TaxID=460826 RepID=UPI00158F265A|nr:uncharacterized protein LOC118072584 [Chelonus insularis]
MAGDIWRSSDASRTSIVQHWCSELVLWRFIIILLSLLSIFCSSSASDSYQNGHSPDFSSFKVIKPRVFHGRHKREIFDTRENEHEHTEVLTIAYDIDGVKRTLDLRLNTDLIPVGYKQRRQHNGGYKTDIPDKVELCHYQGSVRGIPGSWVALSTCRGLKGVVFDGENTHYIHPETESLDAIHYLYDHKHFIGNNTCGYKGHHEASIPSIISHKNFRRKRAAEVVRGPYNSNRQSRYVELVLVIDKKEYMALGENLDKVYHHCKDIANIINALFTPLNIFVALVGVEVWTDSDEITLSPKGDATLANFLRYRREMLVKEIPNDNAQLLTKAKFEEGVVGKALKGPICTFEFSGGVSIDHSSVIGIVAATVAHEMGHNFGMEHDSANCSCPEERCIMAASSGSTGPVHWSSCSLEYLALAFEHGMDYCLRNKPTKLFDSPICGNGFVESGEQCDCGLKENCDNPCCNATTCMLHSNASCATGKCCDLTTCKPKNAGTECRSAEHECDLPEYCTGQSEYCPQDVFKIDGESCNVGKAFCYQGSCRTHNDQCKLLWGPSGFSSDAQCYHMNSKGTKLGNCGYNRLESSYIKCNDEHILCGMLHCKHLNERLEFGMESVAILSHSFINNGGKIIACRSAIVDLGLNQVDPGLAPDGAKCAPGKMCVNQKCMPIADLRASTIGKDSCPNNCGGNGVCNSLGHCHCNRGFRPPDCVHPGFGGSDDSGPAEDPNARNDFITALYVIFLGILPVAGLVSLAVWCRNNNSPGTIGWKKQIIPTHDRGFMIKTIDHPRNIHHHHHHQPSNRIETIDSTLAQDPACASLLPKSEDDERFNNNLFGQFKGFTLAPLSSVSVPPTHKLLEPTKPAPEVPVVAIKTNLNSSQRNNSRRCGFITPLLNNNNNNNNNKINEIESKAPALPPLNPGSTARPLISSPVLSMTTCTSMDFVPAKIPTRPAPEVPSRPLETLKDSSTASVLQKSSGIDKPDGISSTLADAERKEKITLENKEKSSTLNRIASILRPGYKEDKNSINKNPHQKVTKIMDKDILRNLEISNPIPQKEIEIPMAAITLGSVENDKKTVVMRAQSMRDSKGLSRPAIHSFGSMRQGNSYKRPTSIPASTRPTSPPPPVPPGPEKPNDDLKIPGLPGYQTPNVKTSNTVVEDTYDDCLNIADPTLNKINEELNGNDNIYAVIEDPIDKAVKNVKEVSEYKNPKPIDSHETPETMGLLSEIVSEISNRNFDSIYSTGTLKKKNNENKQNKCLEISGSNSSLGTYVNSSHYKSPGSVYSNSASAKFNSAISETSSGYLLPSAVNVPKKDDESHNLLPNNKKNDKVQTNTSGSKTECGETNSVVSDDMKVKKNHIKSVKIPLSNMKNSLTNNKDNIMNEEGKIEKQNSEINVNNQTSPDKSKSFPAKTIRQSSDTSLKSTKSVSSKEKKDGISSSSVNSKNSPDVVSSCSTSSSNHSESPDVVGINSKFKNIQKFSVQTQKKTTSIPPRPGSIVAKAATFTEKKKSPTSVKNLSVTKSDIRSDIKNPIKKAAGSKINVASLQQKFEQNKPVNSVNAVKNVSSVKKTITNKNDADVSK